MASVAIAGASVIAINPAAPSLALPALQQEAVQLSAWIDPIGVWGQTIATTIENLGTRGSDLAGTGLPAAWEIITNSSLYSEIAHTVLNPSPGLEQFFSNLPSYTATINAGLAASNAGLTEHFSELPAVLQAAWEAVQAGQFTQGFANIASWAIFGLGEAGWPLYPAFEIPGQIARDFGATALAAVLDAVFVGDTTTTGYAYSLLGPPITAIYQLTDILNVVSASIYDGDWVTAVSEVVNAPAKVLNAFLNGYQSSVSPSWEVFPGIFTEGGPIDAFFVKLPQTIAQALAGVTAEAETSETTADATLATVSSTELAADGDLVTLSVDTATTATPTGPVADESPTVPTEVPPTDDAATPVVDVEETTEDEDSAEAEPTDAGTEAEAEPSDEGTDAADEASEDEGNDSSDATDTDASADSKSADSASKEKADGTTSEGSKSDSSKSDSANSGGDE
ncbi:hypothetical protein [Mycolicibacterium sp. CR10]|uniref:hypothetical protein n=1 Tax=Mycolicibacterium sp. CR10 TaxID=2562314 RepID=UPI001F0F530C|nr:hypothetical protein [Mycolicibacterium sp. CR10]